MAKAKWLILFVLTLIPVLVFAQDKTQDKPVANLISINSKEFKGFDKCNISNKLSNTIYRLMATGKPIKKEKDALAYAIKSEVMGLPVKAIKIGVCDASGSQACGWGSYLAVVIAKPLKEARDYLKKKTGIDFTKEKRSEDSEVTLRPVLTSGEKSDESILFCDPGVL